MIISLIGTLSILVIEIYFLIIILHNKTISEADRALNMVISSVIGYINPTIKKASVSKKINRKK